MKAKRPMPAPATRTDEAALPDWDALAEAAESEDEASLLPELEPDPAVELSLLPAEPDSSAPEPEPVVAPAPAPPRTTVVDEPTDTWKEVRPLVPLMGM